MMWSESERKGGTERERARKGRMKQPIDREGERAQAQTRK